LVAVGAGVSVGGTEVAVAVGGTAVLVAVGGIGVSVGGTAVLVAVGGNGVLVAIVRLGGGVIVGTALVGVTVGISVAVPVAVGRWHAAAELATKSPCRKWASTALLLTVMNTNELLDEPVAWQMLTLSCANAALTPSVSEFACV
jgi:hypothetical protein